MSEHYFVLSTEDTKEPPRVLTRAVGGKGSEALPPFKNLVCSRCRKLDTLAALQRSIPRLLGVPSQRVDAQHSQDHLLLVSSRSRILFERTAAGSATYFAVPAVMDQHIMYPQRIFFAPGDSRILKPVEPAIP